MPNASHNGNWNADGRVKTTHGYVRVRVGKDHPLADSKGWAYEHELTWLSAGRRIPDDHVIHHINGDKTDNRLANLALITRSEHAVHHVAEIGRDERGRFCASEVTS